ncbi:MAG TPA: DUF1801 domain-containing protein [Anaerolineales bacterium]|nr:DUF1801 domain-containing protein [Anaerolineales bacterium]
MSENKTKPTDAKVEKFLNSVENEKRKIDSFEVLELMKQITGEPAKMWGDSIVGFGSYHYKYASGREGDWFLAGFSPRKQSLTLYITAGFIYYEELLAKLGKYKTGKSCLYINKLEDVDQEVLKELIKESVEHMRSGGTPKY